MFTSFTDGSYGKYEVKRNGIYDPYYLVIRGLHNIQIVDLIIAVFHQTALILLMITVSALSSELEVRRKFFLCLFVFKANIYLI